jgi:hypothetical protein
MLKKIVFIFIVLCSTCLKAQEKHYVSIDPFLPVFGTTQLQYERGISKNMSLSLSVGFKLSSGIFKLRGIDTNKIITEDFNFKGIKIIPEYRWYLQKQGLSGFYLGAYLKFQQYTNAIDGTYIDNSAENFTIALDAKIKTLALGVQLGYKLIVIKNFFIDFLITGPGLSFNTFELKENAPIPQGFYDDLSEAISNYGIFDFIDTDFQINANQKSETKILPAFRYGIKFGYRF